MSSSYKNMVIKNLIFIVLLSYGSRSFCEQELNAQEFDIETIKKHDLNEPNNSSSLSQEIVIDEHEFGNSETLPQTTLNTPEPLDDEEIDSTPNREQDLEKLLAQATENERCEVLLKQVLENFRALDFDLEHIALVVNNNQIRTLKNKQPILEEIRKLRSIVGMVQGGAFVVIKNDNLAQLIELAQKLINHIRYVLTTDLINFKTFDLEASLAPANRLKLPKTYGFEQLETMLTKNNTLLTKLETESVYVGLNTFHRVYRRLEKLNHDYKVLYRLALVAIPVGIYVWCAYRTDDFLGKAWNYFFGSKKSNEDPKNLQKSQLEQSANQPTEHQSTDANKPQAPEKINVFNNQNANNNAQEYIIQSLLKQNEALLSKKSKKTLSAEAAKQMYNDASPLKKLTGRSLTPYEIKHGYDPNDVTIGWLTKFQHKFEQQLGLISFAVPSIAVFELLKPKAIEWAKAGYEWVTVKCAQIASFLRGGPVKRQMEIWAEKEIRITFDDVIGNEHAKETLWRIVSYLVDYEKFDRAGIIPETGILLVGPPRTGKTYIAEALAGTIKSMLRERGSNETIRLLSFTAAELKQYGISTVLLGAKALAPVVIFIDEIDTGRFQREGDAAALGELQVAMSTLNRDKSKKVIILAATNKPENLDYALLEPGRFGKHIDFTYPTFSERKEYLQRELSKRSANIAEDYIDKLSHESENCSYDALNEVIVTALQKAKMRGSVLTWEDLDAAFDEEINKIIIDEQTIPEAEQYVIAAHQAGHAYMRILLNASQQLTKVTIRPTSAKINEQAVISKYFDTNNTNKNQKETKTIEYGKVFTAHNAISLKFETYQDLINELMISLAGHIAEKILFGSTSYGYHSTDNDQALNIAKHIMFNGMQEKDMPKVIKEQKLTDAYLLVQKYVQEVDAMLQEHKKELIVLTNMLFEQKTLLAGEVMQILELVEKQKANGPNETLANLEDLDNCECCKPDELVGAPAA